LFLFSEWSISDFAEATRQVALQEEALST